MNGLPVKAKSADKIEYIASPPLSWVTAGDEAIGDMFGNWLRQQMADTHADVQEWGSLARFATLKLADFNGTRVQASRRSGLSLDADRDLCQVLMTGYIAGAPEIVHLEVNGDWNLHVAAGRIFASMGAGVDLGKSESRLNWINADG